jgi:hypothetical protein
MKAVVIENDYNMPLRLRQWLDYRQKDLFEEVVLEIGCDRRPLEDLVTFLPQYDAVLIDSTFINKHQVEMLLISFAKGSLRLKPYKFYIAWGDKYLNDWLHNAYDKREFVDSNLVKECLIEMFKEHEIWTVPLQGEEKQLHYSETWNVVYIEGEDPQTVYNELPEK